MNLLEQIKFSPADQIFPSGINPVLQDYLHVAYDIFRSRPIKKTIKLVVTAPPLKRFGNSILFHAFASNKTAYGTIEDLEKVFADWFIRTDILPIINPIPFKYIETPQLLPKAWYSPIRNRGVLIYKHGA